MKPIAVATLIVCLLVWPGFAAETAPLLSAATFDIASSPKGVLLASRLQQMWNVHKTARQCFEHANFASGPGYRLSLYSATDLRARPLRSPFPPPAANVACEAGALDLKGPAPLVSVDLNSVFFQKTRGLNTVIRWFSAMSMRSRSSAGAEGQGALRTALVDWARADALRKGIYERGGERVDWEISTLIAALVNGYAETLSLMTAEERGLVGAWLNKLVAKTMAATYGWRNQNRPYLEALLALNWGLTIADAKSVQYAINVYKLAIHDMRPDGSHVIDSERAGVALHANQMATGNLVMLASVLKTSLGLDVFAYKVDGRSIHTAVDYVVATIKDPSLNAKYALACPGAGDEAGSIASPNMFWVSPNYRTQEFSLAYLLAYASYFPEREASRWVGRNYSHMYRTPTVLETFGGSPVCLLDLKAQS